MFLDVHKLTNDINFECINKIFKYYELYGNKDYIGESVTQTEHMIQAAMLAENDKQDDYIILAALFHDIGHLIQFESEVSLETMGNYGVKNHEKIGKKFLEDNNVPYPIPQLVENHVKVKRYLTFKNAEYINVLSNASKETLKRQGGPFNLEQANDFESDPLFEKSLLIRNYDDKAKENDIELKSLEYYKNKLINIINT